MQADRTSKDTGLRIRRARERAGMSREELATQVGRSLRAVGAWERGENIPQSLGLLSAVLGVDLERTEPEPGGVLLQEATNGQLLGELADRLGKAGHHGQTSQEQRQETGSAVHPRPNGGTPITGGDDGTALTGEADSLTAPLDFQLTPKLGQGDGTGFDDETVGSLEHYSARNDASADTDTTSTVQPASGNTPRRRNRASG